jgi:hypothetical protein
MVQDGLYCNERAVGYVADLRNLSIRERSVAYSLALHADETGRVTVPLKVLARESSLKPEALSAVMESLEAKGVILESVGVFRMPSPVAA